LACEGFVVALDPRLSSSGGVAVPTYEFECQKCGKEFELILSLKQYEQKEFACPACRAKEVEPLVTSTNVITSRKS
jgi:putative FmdB family regulatory protein